jgi:hypothetical protein
MSVCPFVLFVLSYVQVAVLRRADDSSKESYRLCKTDYETEVEARAQQRSVEPLMNEYTFRIMSVVNISAKRWDASHLMVGSMGTDI